MNSKVYKWCAVPDCKNTSIKKPDKVFVYVPNIKKIRDTWLKLARRNPKEVATNSPLYFCEDHFDLPNDMQNYMQYHLMGSVSKVLMKPGVMPKKFACQPDRQKRTTDTPERPYVAKKRRMLMMKEIENEYKEKNVPSEQSSTEQCASGSSDNRETEVRLCPTAIVSRERNNTILDYNKVTDYRFVDIPPGLPPSSHQPVSPAKGPFVEFWIHDPDEPKRFLIPRAQIHKLGANNNVLFKVIDTKSSETNDEIVHGRLCLNTENDDNDDSTGSTTLYFERVSERRKPFCCNDPVELKALKVTKYVIS